MSYNKQSHDACDFINHDEIIDTLRYAEQHKDDEKTISDILRKAAEMRGLDHREAAVLLLAEDPATRQRVAQLASTVSALSSLLRSTSPTTVSMVVSIVLTTLRTAPFPVTS